MKVLSNEPHAVHDREVYHWYASHGICVRCHSDEVYKKQSKTLCLNCMMDMRERGRKYYKDNKDKMSTEQRYNHHLHQKRRMDLLRAFGVCLNCQKRDAVPGKVKCSICLAKARAYNEKKRKEKGSVPMDFKSPAVCSHCKKEKPDDGRKLCPECYDKAVSALKIARSRRDTKNHYWNTDNKIAFERYESV